MPAPAAPRPSGPALLVAAVSTLVVSAYLLFLSLAALRGAWLFAGDGRYVPADFVAFYAAGRLALAGEAPAAYDWLRHHAAAEAAIGPFGNRLPWLNPPHFLLVVAPFAALPYGVAALGWIAATAAAFAAMLGRIVGRLWAVPLALAFPAVLINAGSGQGGLLNAALLGSGLLLLPGRPAWAGLLLGCLTVKPQLGLLVPIALLAGGHRRAAGAAVATALALALASALLFGPETWPGFARSLAAAGDAVVGGGQAGWSKMQSAYGAVRFAGGSAALAWAATAVLAVAVAVAVARAWRGEAPFALKAALLASGALLVQPYVFLYDGALLGVALAFLLRHALSHGFLRLEAIGMAAACLPLAQAFTLDGPVGFVSALGVFGLVLRRLPRAGAGEAVDFRAAAAHNGLGNLR